MNRACRPGSKAAFTLVEILVAITILAILTLVMAAIFGNTSTLVSQSNTTMGALDAGEAVLGQIGLDISRMVLRDDVDYDFTKQAGNDRLSFYARTSGFDTSGTFTASFDSTSNSLPRPLSVVSYVMGVNPNPTTPASTSPQLNYGALQIGWPTAGATAFTLSALASTSTLGVPATGVPTQYLYNTSPSSSGPSDLPLPTSYTTLASEVIRFEYCFVLKTDPVASDNPPKLITWIVPPTVSGTPPPIENIAGIIVAIVVVDPRSRVLFPTGADVTLAAKFPDAQNSATNPPSQDILAIWAPLLTPATLTSVNIPTRAIEGIHVYQRYFPFPW